MISRITAEFETPELAELALKRAKEKTDGIFKSGMIYSRVSERNTVLRSGEHISVIPTAANLPSYQNFMTASMDSPTSKDSVPEPSRNRKTRIYVICSAESCGEICSILGSLGGLRIKSSM